MKYTLRVESKFDSAHNLRGYDGNCANLHGHSWKVEVAVSSEELDQCGMAIDFKLLKRILKEEISQFDHHYLNELPIFETQNPTAENISRELYMSIGKKLPDNICLKYVKIWESPEASATYGE